jgi:hypothetical protein
MASDEEREDDEDATQIDCEFIHHNITIIFIFVSLHYIICWFVYIV